MFNTGIKSTHRDGQRTAVDVALKGGSRDIAEFITNYQCSPKGEVYIKSSIGPKIFLIFFYMLKKFC